MGFLRRKPVKSCARWQRRRRRLAHADRSRRETSIARRSQQPHSRERATESRRGRATQPIGWAARDRRLPAHLCLRSSGARTCASRRRVRMRRGAERVVDQSRAIPKLRPKRSSASSCRRGRSAMTAPIRLAAASNSAIFAWMGGVGRPPGHRLEHSARDTRTGPRQRSVDGYWLEAIARSLEHSVQPARPASDNRVLR
jgi:hypothetical protein